MSGGVGIVAAGEITIVGRDNYGAVTRKNRERRFRQKTRREVKRDGYVGARGTENNNALELTSPILTS